jgi:ABC-type branched-subunit amino acid transport system ATPase component/branched-subunit amino acid ABC-type transport system permease component
VTTVIQFAVLGLATGGALALLSQGIVLIYRGSGVVNFAHGAMAMLGALLYYEGRSRGWGFLPSAGCSVVIVAVLGMTVYQLIMRPLKHASTLSATVATLGLLILIQGLGVLGWGQIPRNVNVFLPADVIRIGGVAVGLDRLLLAAIAALLTLGLWAVSRFTVLGLAVRAAAENRRSASALGWSPDALGTLTWGAGAGLAAVAGILIAPLSAISTVDTPLLVIPALAAVMLGRFASFPRTLAGAFGIGIAQAEVAQYVHVPGAIEAVPFVVILLLLVGTGSTLPTRSEQAARLPEIGSGRVNIPVVLTLVAVVAVLLLTVFSIALVVAVTISLAWAVVLLSVVLLLGYAGQLSLAQFTLAGIGALLAAQMVSKLGLPFEVALVLAVACAVPVGLVFALPALRARGTSLAVVTLGLGVTVNAMIFNNATFIGGPSGLVTGAQSVFGVNLDTILHPDRYAVFVLIAFAACCLFVARLRRSSAGRALIAVRTNERAAAVLGINVLSAKLYAFGLASAIAALGGVLLGFSNSIVDFTQFPPLASVQVVSYSVVGGVGYIPGAPIGSGLAAGGLGNWLMQIVFPGLDPTWLEIIGGVAVILLVVLAPDGLTKPHVAQAHWLRAKLARGRHAAAAPVIAAPVTGDAARPLWPASRRSTVEVEDLTVRFGGVTALDGVNVAVRPGEVVALIGPNGAGKTTLIDALTGFVAPAGGVIRKDGEPITDWSVHRRSRAGLSRSFQSLELFESSTVRENVQVASDPHDWRAYTSAFTPARVGSRQPPPAAASIAALGIEPDLDTRVSDLPYGRRRLVAIARAMATNPSILLLDEPAAGLSGAESSQLARVVRRVADEWGIGILLVEHDMSFVMGISDHVVVLDFGRQIAAGTPTEIRADEAVIGAYLGVAPTAPAALAVGVEPASSVSTNRAQRS